MVSDQNAQILSSYIDKNNFLLVKNISLELQNETMAEIKRLEVFIDEEVIHILKKRLEEKK